MDKKQVQKRIEKLKKVINHHRYFYHVLDKQEISESALDSLKKELFDLEQKYPEFVTSDSPTQRVAGKPLKKFEKVRHSQPMLSFNDAFSEKDMTEWQERISKLLTSDERSKAKRTSSSSSPSLSLRKSSVIDFYCELKIDGLAIELVYENGTFKIGSTRGNGLIGENVTQNLKTIEAVPLILENRNQKVENRKIVARGEVFIPGKELERINIEQKKRGLSIFANPRNMAAGSVRQLKSQITAQRHLDSFAYELITDFGQKIPRSLSATGIPAEGLGTHEEKHKILKCLGFKTNPHNKYCRNLKEVFEFHNFWQKNREKLPYEIDGIVVIVNSNKIYTKLGVVGKAPRGAIAYKFPLKQATTIVEGISVQVGRTGALTPVAHLKPVEVGGVIISRATLHNEDEIKKLGVKIGDTVIVGRAGDVIPDIVKVLPELRTGKEKEFKFPQKCPACGGKVIRPSGEVVWRCVNPKCFARQKEYFYHFVSRGGFDIVGLGPKIIDKLIDEGLASDPADFFKLEEGDILPLARFAEKSAKNLIEAVQSKKKITLSKFIYSLGIRNAGEETTRDLAEYFGSIEKLEKANMDKLQKIMDIGPVVAKSIYKFFQEKRNLNFIEKLKKAGVIIQYQKSKIKYQKLRGKIFVLTGGLESMTREDVKEKIRFLGGEISESISKKTDYLVVGKEPGSKFEKAMRLGVKIINEKEFLELIR